MEATLLLNASHEPLQIISWQRAITLLFQGKVEVLENHDKDIHSVSIVIKMPAVVRLLNFVRFSRFRTYAKFSRANIFERDEHQCQYCGEKMGPEELTFDHVIPVSEGGTKTWENIVSACIDCNALKGNRTLKQARMKLIKKPIRPRINQIVLTVGRKSIPKCWLDYLYWEIELK